MRAAVAAGHPATVDAGIEILEEGGNAADAAVAASLASCVAEPRTVELVHLEVPFGAELIHYAVGIGSCGVPGVLPGLGELSARDGSLPWARLVEPALKLARDGVEMLPAHASCLEMLAP